MLWMGETGVSAQPVENHEAEPKEEALVKDEFLKEDQLKELERRIEGLEDNVKYLEDKIKYLERQVDDLRR